MKFRFAQTEFDCSLCALIIVDSTVKAKKKTEKIYYRDEQPQKSAACFWFVYDA